MPRRTPTCPKFLLTKSQVWNRDFQNEGLDDIIIEQNRQFENNRSHVRECKEAFDRTWWLQPLVLPEYKLAFCYVPKVACTQFKDLFNYLNGKNNKTNSGFGSGYLASMMRGFNLTDKEVTRRRGWKFATFTRDPALRYLSAFGSTCVSDKNGKFEHHSECCGRAHSSLLERQHMAMFFRERVEEDLDTGLVKEEDHWVMQAEILRNCGWDKFRPGKVDYWGMLSSDMNRQVKEMMAMVGYFNDSVIERFFPKDRPAGHTNPMPGKPLDYIEDIKTLEGIVKLYEDDYKEMPGIGCSFTEPALEQLTAANESLRNTEAVRNLNEILIQKSKNRPGLRKR